MTEKEMDSLARKKPSLPPGWSVEVSTTYPDRVYYFNSITGATSWKCPQLLSDADSTESVEALEKKEKKTQEADPSTSLDCTSVNQKYSPELCPIKDGHKTNNNYKRKIVFDVETAKNPSCLSRDKKHHKGTPNPNLNKVSGTVSSQNSKRKRKKLKRPVLDNSNELNNNSTQSKRIILKAKRFIDTPKTGNYSRGRSSLCLRSNSTNESSVCLTSNLKKKCADQLTNNNIINLKNTKSRFRQTLDQNSSLVVEDDLSDDLLASTSNERYNQDVEMPDLSELLTNDDMPEPMQTEDEIPSDNGLFIVVDTNVFIHSLKYIENLIESSYDGWGYPNIRIPWAVIQELDSLKNYKNGKNSSTGYKAADAVRFVYKMLVGKHPRIRGQTAADANKISGNLNAECNDDKILQCCIQLSESVGRHNVILLTEDKNLCNKAFINDIEAHTTKTLHKIRIEKSVLESRKSPEKVALLETSNVKKECMKPEEKVPEISNLKKEQRKQQLEQPVNEAQQITKDLLSWVVETEMTEAFGSIWERIVIRKPPWTLSEVLECIHRHWIAVFGFLFQRDMKKASEDLASLLKHGLCDPENEQEITKMFEYASSICTCIYVKYRSESADRALNQLRNTRQWWQTVYKPESQLLESSQSDECRDAVFSSFNYVWSVINYVCGIIQDRLNYQCNITYERPEVLPSHDEVVLLIPEVRKKLDHMYRKMNIILTSPVKDDYYRKALFEFHTIFQTFTENLNIQVPQFSNLKLVIPEMLEEFCTNENNKEKLANGYHQLSYFLSVIERIANDLYR